MKLSFLFLEQIDKHMNTVRKLQRDFIIGDNWLYYKIYTGSIESILEILNDSIKKWQKQGIIDNWFFIRYADPHHHLRLRFHLTDFSKIGGVLESIKTQFIPYIEEGIIWKVQLDTYSRELERYGYKTMQLSEQIFTHDSNMMIELFSLIEGEEGEEIRWLFCLRAIDDFISAFNLGIEQKISLFDRLKTGFGIEFRIDRTMKKKINEKYRNHRSKIKSFMALDELNEYYLPLFHILEHKRKAIDTIAKEIIHSKEVEPLDFDFELFLESHVHMITNRIFRFKNRLHELVCYDFLFKHYMSIKSKEQKLLTQS